MRYRLAIGLSLLTGCLAGAPPQESSTGAVTNGLVEPEGQAKKAPPPTPIPHLVVAQSGEDLGPLAGDNCAINPTAGGETCFFTAILYDQPDCAGNAYLGGPALHANVHVLDAAGNVLQWQGGQQSVTILSAGGPFATCSNRTMVMGTSLEMPLVPTGVTLALHAVGELSVELR